MRNKKSVLLLILAVMFCMPLSVKAHTISQYAISVDGKNVVKAYDNEAPGEEATPQCHPTSGNQPLNCLGNTRTLRLLVDDTTGYCIEFNHSLGLVPSASDGTNGEVAYTTNLRDFLGQKVNSSKLDKLISDLNLINYYGYKAGDGTRGSDVYYLATQAMIWQTLSDAGMYMNVPIAEQTDLLPAAKIQELLNTSTRNASSYMLKNIRFMKYNSVPAGGLENLDYDPTMLVNMNSAKTAINRAISKQATLPSFCGNGTVNLGTVEIGKEINLHDQNDVLDKYAVQNCNGANCNINGSDLTIKAGNTSGNISITLKRSGEGYTVDSLSNKVYQLNYYNQGKPGQGVAVFAGPLPERTCTITATVKEPELGCYICGSDYKWGKPGDEGIDEENCELQESVETVANCKPNLACYKCEEDGTFKYRWGRLGDEGIDEESCELQEDIDELDNCKDPIPSEAPPSSEPEESSPPTAGLRIAYVSLVCGFAAAIAFVYFYSKKPMDE